MATVKHEARGPNIEEIRDNIVHVLGTFTDDASSLTEYREMMASLGADTVDANTGFIVMPCFSGGDLSKRMQKKKADGETFAEHTILECLLRAQVVQRSQLPYSAIPRISGKSSQTHS